MFSSLILPLTTALLLHSKPTIPSPITPQDQDQDQKPLYELHDRSITVWLSTINATIFGVEAEDFDYVLGGPEGVPEAIETAEHFAAVYHTGTPEEVLVAFLNATTGGATPVERVRPVFDREWLCWDLSCPMNEGAKACEGIEIDCWEGREEL